MLPVQRYDAYLTGIVAERTKFECLRWAERFEAWRLDRPYDDRVIRDYVRHLIAKQVLPSSIRTIKGYLFRYLRFLREEAGVPLPQQMRVDIPRDYEPLRWTPTEEVVCEFMRQAAGKKQPFATLLCLFPVTGFRDSEMCALRFADWRVTKTGAVIFVVRAPKNRRDREVPMLWTGSGSEVEVLGRRALHRYLTEIRPASEVDSEWLFPSPRGADRHITRIAVERSIREVREAIGAPKLTAHSMRRFFTTYLLDKGVQAATVAKMIGHSNMMTFHKYYKPSADQLARAMEVA